MSRRVSSCVVITSFAFLFISSGVQSTFAQSNDNSAEKAPQPRKFETKTDLALGLYGQLTRTREVNTTTVFPLVGTSSNQVTQGATSSAGILGTFHQQFKTWLGYNVNAGYTQFTEHYSNGIQFTPAAGSEQTPQSSFVRGAVRTGMTDLSVAAVFEGPRTRQFRTFAQFGGGGLFFNPLSSQIGAKTQIRPAMVFGAGANYNLTAHLDLRAEYRGYFYKSPDFGLPDIQPGVSGTNQFPMTRLFTVTGTPAVSLVYRFGGVNR